MNTIAKTLALAGALTFSCAAFSQVTVKDPWVRGTVAQQMSTGAFMTLTADADVRLVSAASPVAGVVEIHEMAMESGVMKMRAVDGLRLPAGQGVDLKPGGYHVMLMMLKRPLNAGDVVPITLTIEKAKGERATVEVKATVRPLGGAMGSGHGKQGH